MISWIVRVISRQKHMYLKSVGKLMVWASEGKHNMEKKDAAHRHPEVEIEVNPLLYDK